MSDNIYEEQKKLVLARLKTINPESKIMLGTKRNISIKELINHVEQGDDFGKKIIQAQMNMLKVLVAEQ
ncbi:MAG TPA: hypothetical protein VJC39_04675 [Candidatus Nanoarchaeia archaeon]|nr:hypothetical protein [Candidatus Nanoarchaeia archaeon]